MTTDYNVTAPHPALQDAAFCYAAHGDGACAELITGWVELCKRMNEELSCSEDDTWGDLMAHLEDWVNDGNNVPFCWHTSFEDGSIRIYRLEV